MCTCLVKRKDGKNAPGSTARNIFHIGIPCMLFFSLWSSLALLAVGLADHVFHYNIKNIADGIAVFQNLPGLIGVEMDFYQILVSSLDQKLCVVAVCELIVLRIN